ncbi:MAG: efflux RND transporter periplasmic adaptor subunit [Planctomycetota bacterium]
MHEKINPIHRAAGRLRRTGGIAAALAAGVLLGALGVWGLAPTHDPTGGADAPSPTTAEAATVWTCSMHPEVRLDTPGLCPKCGMELIPVEQAAAPADAERTFTTTPEARALMNLQSARVERRFPTVELRMVGKVEYDETRLAAITAWVGGRLDRLFVDVTGEAVKRGEPMVEIYSPELVSAQEELLQALRSVDALGRSDVSVVRRTSQATVEAAREKLRLLGLSDEQIAAIEQRGSASEHLTLNAPVSGIVVHRNAREGMYVRTGTQIYTVADLSVVWVKLDAYESDLDRLREGQPVEFTSVAYPGETFAGTVALIDPILDPATRTVNVRVNVPNPDGRLKPGMFVTGRIRARLAAGGRVLEVDETTAETADAPLVIPASAPLITGTRAVVYVRVPDADQPTFEGREVVLGPRAGDAYVVREGLAEGDVVVTRGAFKIDAALQIQAKPSMMSPGERGAPTGHDHGAAPIRHGAAGPAPDFVNTRCPIMGGTINPANVTDDLVRTWRGRRIAFCCAGCPQQWDELPDARKEAKLDAVTPSQQKPTE